MHSWEEGDAPDEDRDADSSGSEGDAPDLTAGQQLVEHALNLYLNRALSARDFCVQMWWAGKGGIQEATLYGFRPDAPTGHYQRHLTSVLPFLRDRSKLYGITVPSYNANDFARSTHELQALPPHEILHESFDADATLRTRLGERVAAKELPPAYFENPIVMGTDDLVVPMSLFVDGVPYSNTDGVIGFWGINEISGARSLLLAVRKSLICQCGCRGHCTYFGVFSFLLWSFRCMASGLFPQARHDGSPWRSSDEARAKLEGTAMRFKACLLYIKGDWAEYSSTLGFPSWGDGLRPCWSCNASRDTLHRTDGISAVGLPWRCNEEGEYFESCARCEHRIVLDAKAHAMVLPLLAYDKRQHGNHGRCLTSPVPSLGLLAGDRLEPSPELPNTSDFDEAAVFPMPVVFWRTSSETMARCRLPLFSSELGITPVRTLTVDGMHCLYLGVMQHFCRHLIWLMISSFVWGRTGTNEETLETAILACRFELNSFFKRRHGQHPEELLTRFKFSRRVIGDWSSRKLGTKAAETWSFLLFLLDKLGAGVGVLGDVGTKFLTAGRHLEEIVLLWRNAGLAFTPVQYQHCFDAWNGFLRLTADVEELEMPKRHLFVHLLSKINWFGNPTRYSVWLDEGLNHRLKLACRTVSQSTFETFLLLRMQELLGREGVKRKHGE